MQLAITEPNFQNVISIILFLPGATVSLNETRIVVQEGDEGNTTVDICVVLVDAMGGLQRDIVVDLTVVPDTTNS